MKNIIKSTFVFLVLVTMGCEPAVDDKIALGEPPVADFDIVAGDTPNDFNLSNATDGAFFTQWDLGAQGIVEGDLVSVNYPNKGDYDVTMTTLNANGSASVTKSLTVTEDDPSACQGVIELLSGCDEKTWKLAPEEGAIFVGPNLVDSWWNNSASDVEDRECHFNDEYIFRNGGEFEYRTNGDFWADTDGDGNIFPSDLGLAPGCQPDSSMPDKYISWSNGIHGYGATESTLTVTGEGAWMGLYKIGTSSEVGAPQSSITYNILEISENRMILFTDYGGLVWRVTFVSE